MRLLRLLGGKVPIRLLQRRLCLGLAGAFACALLGALPRVAFADFSNLVVFGDSLSDVGNLSQSSFGLYPGPYYFSGRVSNGTVWAEHFSVALGQGALTRSLVGGDDFAYAGARTTGTGGLEGIFISDLDEQVTNFVNNRAGNASTLYVVWVGANDLLNQLEGGGGTEQQYVNRIITDMGRLVTDGARQFLVPNLPDLGLTPRFSPNPTAALTASDAFNAALDTALDALESSNPALTIYRLDIHAAFNQIVANPGDYGLTNVTDPAAPGLEVGASSYNTNLIVPNPDQYLFWDELHPTRAGHALLGEFALSAIPEPSAAYLLLLGLALLARRRSRALRVP